MHAAGYIGRVGGLAVALGWAPPFSPGRASRMRPKEMIRAHGAPTGQEQGGGGTTTAVKETDSGGPGTIDFKLPRLSDIIGRHRADDMTPNSNTADSIVKRLSDAAKRVTDAIENAAEADNTVVRSTTNTGGSSLRDRLLRERSALTRKHYSGHPDRGRHRGDKRCRHQPVRNRATAVKDWIASPLALAGRSAGTTPTISPPTSLWTPSQSLAPLGTMKATPGTGATAVRTTSC